MRGISQTTIRIPTRLSICFKSILIVNWTTCKWNAATLMFLNLKYWGDVCGNTLEDILIIFSHPGSTKFHIPSSKVPFTGHPSYVFQKIKRILRLIQSVGKWGGKLMLIIEFEGDYWNIYHPYKKGEGIIIQQ